MNRKYKGVVHVERDKSSKREWRWRAISNNGNNVANCGEGYANKNACWRMAFIEARARGYEIKTAPARRVAATKSRALKRRAPPRVPPATKASQEQKSHG